MGIGKTNATGSGKNEVVITGTGKYLVRAIDYDGTLLKGEWLDSSDTFTLPTPPSHDGLVFDGWSAPVTITNNTISSISCDITAGCLYHTESGKMELQIFSPLKPNRVYVGTDNGTTLQNIGAETDWGDGTVNELNYHMYDEINYFTLKRPYNGYRTPYTIEERLPSTITSYSSDTSSNTLKKIAMPISITKIKPDVSLRPASGRIRSFYENYCLECVVIPSNVTIIGYETFYQCFALKDVVIPLGVTEIGDYAFYECRNLKRIIFPASLTSIGSSAFYNCFGCIFDFRLLASVPTLSNADAFNVYSNTWYNFSKIVVPDNLYSSWIATNNWSNIADKIISASDYELL